MQQVTRGRLGWLVAVLALVAATGGTAFAAKRYVISSTKQISPGVLKALKGKAGAKGTTGKAGPAGAIGPAGAAGTPGATGAKGEKGEAAETGSTGATGATGARGTTGATGPDSASVAEYRHPTGVDILSADATTPVVIGTVALPAAGDYLVQYRGQANVTATNATNAGVSCRLITAAGLDDGQFTVSAPPAPNTATGGTGTLLMTMTVHTTAPSTASVSCAKSAAAVNATVSNSRLTITKVGAVSSQTF